MEPMKTRYKVLAAGLWAIAIVTLLSFVPLPRITITWGGNPYLAKNLLAQALSSDLAWSRTGKLVISGSAAPTISSGFGTGPSVSAENGAAVFIVNVGTGGAASAGVVGMPTAATGWTCYPNDITAALANTAGQTKQTASATTTVSVQHQTTSTGAALVWTASDLVRFICFAF